VKALKAPNSKSARDEKHEGAMGDNGPGKEGPITEEGKHKGTKGKKGPGKEQPTMEGEKDPADGGASCSGDV
jgi:hypothetical protein